ncbi:hypothetical protein SASPL_104647 [Salvia splendens]|uniref:Uncharacterized protein n=1 Tax=Salvia splendens TaxID=180675 RepID=A0A8X8YM18_SALSN|nr:uncharacterized protein LOC121769298 [Salvia splendens]KAG6433042.1 hypothetical protein SASPL_104647 [Salvia splendens]
MDFDHDADAPLLLNSPYFHQQKSMDEMKQLFKLSMELQETRVRADHDLKSRDAQILHLKELLTAAIKERDEARTNCKKILLDKILLHQSAPNSGISSIDGLSSSDCEESIASSPHRVPAELIKGPLPEKGKLLQAVVKAGPLLQTLLLAGPLPQWRHPPPVVDPYQIPPPHWAGRKRGLSEVYKW